MNGWTAIPDKDIFTHCFGGTIWHVSDPKPLAGGPTLLLSLDLTDPKLADLQIKELSTLPVCSYINCDVWIEPQHFQIRPDKSDIILVRRSTNFTTILDGNLAYPNPLPKTQFSLRPISFEQGDDSSVDSFVGGSSFIRILGPILWLQGVESQICDCGNEQKYVSSIGYDFPFVTGFVADRPFFIGEAALYFFLCPDCLILSVISQST